MSDIQEGECLSHQQSESSQQYIRSRAAGRMHICGICRTLISKYTCPKCQQKTCSLSCTNKHKQLKMCSGIKQPNQYIQLNQYQQPHARKDFGYIKDIIDKTDKVKKCLAGVTTPFLQPKRFQILRMNAKKLHNITLYHAPAIIQRHRENISFFFMKTKQIYWVFELMFYKKKSSHYQWIKTLTLPYSDHQSFAQMITHHNFLSPILLQQSINTLKVQQFTVYIQNKQFINTQQPTTYLKCKTSQQINNCLKNIKIYQFPTLMIVHHSLINHFQQQFNI